MTVIGWAVYAFAISLFLATGAWLLEHGLSRIGMPVRWVWLGALRCLRPLLPEWLPERRLVIGRAGFDGGSGVGRG